MKLLDSNLKPSDELWCRSGPCDWSHTSWTSLVRCIAQHTHIKKIIKWEKVLDLFYFSISVQLLTEWINGFLSCVVLLFFISVPFRWCFRFFSSLSVFTWLCTGPFDCLDFLRRGFVPTVIPMWNLYSPHDLTQWKCDVYMYRYFAILSGFLFYCFVFCFLSSLYPSPSPDSLFPHLIPVVS